MYIYIYIMATCGSIFGTFEALHCLNIYIFIVGNSNNKKI